ncbi:MAG TPA: TonB C-terminal domain-containing protein [Longimicrobiales bacterium]|nr:TonB C-terminal domain-containing protein [Longimicrobiales bacterium]
MGSLLVHGAVGVLTVLAALQAPEPLNFITFEVEIVSPPSRQEPTEEPAPAPEEDLVVERPDEAPVEEVEDVPLPEARPKPEPTREEPRTRPPEPAPEPERREETPAPAAAPSEEESELSGEDIEVRMEGVRRDFPQYYDNIIRQISRCFRPPAGIPGGLRTTVYFVIRQDGTVGDLRFVEQSGNPDFDFEALGAVGDCAGRGRFGPLPEELPYERLPILFEFRPPGGERMQIVDIPVSQEGTSR